MGGHRKDVQSRSNVLDEPQQVERHEYERLLVVGLLLLKQQPERARGPWPWRQELACKRILVNTPHMMTSSSHYLNIKGRHGGFHVRAGGDEKQIINFAWPYLCTLL